jgi:uncharacterized phage-associated protein
MPQIAVKIKAFEFITEKLLEWHGLPNNNEENDFSKLKLFKLLFFVSAVNASKTSNGLLDIFTNFSAMPYGPVESDVYENFKSCRKVTVNQESTKINEVEIDYYLEINDFKQQIIDSINALKKANKELVYYSAYDLVELSHQWISWKSIFNLARKQDKLSLPIPTSLIKIEPKIFKLTVNEFV